MASCIGSKVLYEAGCKLSTKVEERGCKKIKSYLLFLTLFLVYFIRAFVGAHFLLEGNWTNSKLEYRTGLRRDGGLNMEYCFVTSVLNCEREVLCERISLTQAGFLRGHRGQILDERLQYGRGS